MTQYGIRTARSRISSKTPRCRDFLAYVALSCDQLPMPSLQGVGSGDRGDLSQGRTAESVRPYGPPPPLVVRQTEPSAAQLPPQEPVLFDQVHTIASRSRRSSQPVSTLNTMCIAPGSIARRSAYQGRCPSTDGANT